MSLTLSVLETNWPGHLPVIVRTAERCGFRRFWATEHHSPGQSASPIVTAALTAGMTNSMRVGSAGVLLNFYSALKVAQDFRLLELYFPSRIDLGVASALVDNNAVMSALMDGRPPVSPSSFAYKLRRLRDYAREGTAASCAEAKHLGPDGVSTIPEIWLCGSSERSAILAGQLGLSYAFHEYLYRSNSRCDDGPSVLSAYRDAFVPCKWQQLPRCTVACLGVCSGDSASAHATWKQATARHEAFLVGSGAAAQIDAHRQLIVEPTFLGSQELAARRLIEVAQAYHVDELAINLVGLDLGERVSGFRLLGESIIGRDSSAE